MDRLINDFGWPPSDSQMQGGHPGLSRYLYSIDIDEHRVVLYSNVYFDPVIVSRSEWAAIRDGRKVSASVAERLECAGLLGTAYQDAQRIEDARARILNSIHSTQVLYFVASDGCDMACSYCPIPVRKNLNSLMSVDIFTRYFHRFVRADKKIERRFIILYGGEPLFNVCLLKHIAAQYENLAVDAAELEILVCSNLTALNENTLAILRQGPFKVVAGIDAQQDRAHATRLSGLNTDTHIDTLRQIEKLVAANIDTYASTTMTPQTAANIPSLLRTLSRIGVRGAGINLLRGLRGWSIISGAGFTLDAYAALVARCFESIIEDVELRKFEYSLTSRYERLVKPINLNLDCHAYGNQVVVYPDGSTGSCYLRGDREGATSQNVSRLPLFNPGCEDCEARPSCGGGCPWSADELTGLGSNIDPIDCRVTRAIHPSIVRWVVR